MTRHSDSRRHNTDESGRSKKLPGRLIAVSSAVQKPCISHHAEEMALRSKRGGRRVKINEGAEAVAVDLLPPRWSTPP